MIAEIKNNIWPHYVPPLYYINDITALYKDRQFFIMHKDAPHLDGAYAAFGKIIEGQDVVNAIAEVATDYSDRPLEDQVMETVVVETFGEEYPEPETV